MNDQRDNLLLSISAQPPHRLLPLKKNLNHFCLDCHSLCDNVYCSLTMFSALAAVCTVYCAIEIVLITLHYMNLRCAVKCPLIKRPRSNDPHLLIHPIKSPLPLGHNDHVISFPDHRPVVIKHNPLLVPDLCSDVDSESSTSKMSYRKLFINLCFQNLLKSAYPTAATDSARCVQGCACRSTMPACDCLVEKKRRRSSISAKFESSGNIISGERCMNRYWKYHPKP